MKEIAKRRWLLVLTVLLIGILTLSMAACESGDKINEIPSDEEYSYINPDETKAQPDAGFVIDGVLDEEAYKNNNWLYLHNDDGGNNVDIAMTSYFGEKGMYFVYDVTETVPIYVNLNRASYMNSCIEMYFAPSWVTSLSGNSLFEVDLLPTGDMTFKMNNGKGGYVNVATTDENMAVLGTTTKGGPVNSEDCYGYCLELFIPWEYMEWVGMDTQSMKQGFVYVDPAHITSNNLTGTDTSVDRYWYFYAQQNGAAFSNVFQYFRFDGNGVIGTAPITLTAGEHVKLEGDPNVLPGLLTTVQITPENGYALTSILVNGEEYIGKVSFNKDGSVSLTVRGENEGLEISAAAEAVTEGNKTLSGTVTMNKPGGDTLEGVLVTYIGPSGERPVELNEDGSFTLSDLPQGYYTLTAEKEGYQKLSRPVYLNRDMQVELSLEFDTFMVQSGTAWILDDQNEGILRKFGGQGYLMSNQSYNKFTFETYLRYDKELAKESDIDAFTQQRSGVRILFSNGKYLYIDALKEGDKYILQYAKHSNSIFDKWKTVCVMDSHQVSKYTSEEGIKLTVKRDRNYIAVYLNGELMAVEKLDTEYASCTAQLGFESWSANRQIWEIPYSITETTSVYVPGAHYLRPTDGWEITGQFWGSLLALSPNADTGWINTYKAGYQDVAVTVTDKTPDANNFRMAIHFEFTNGETFRISLTNADSGELGVYKLQVMGANSIVKDWITPYRLTSAQVTKLQSGEGIEFRVAIVGETALVYLDDVQVCALDLSKDLEGNATNIAGKTAKIGLRLYGNENQWMNVPIKLSGAAKTADIQVADASQVTVVGDSHTVGETIVLKPTDEGCEFVSLKIDGVEVELTDKTQYTFVATQDVHTVEAVSQRIRDWNPKENAGHTWNLDEQTSGIITSPASVSDTGWMWTYAKAYRDISLTVSDKTPDANNFRMAVHMDFTNGETFRISLTNADSGALGTYKIQLMGANSIVGNWGTPYVLTEAQAAKLQSGEGMEFRVAIVGNNANVYLDGICVCSLDLPAGNVAGVPAKIAVRLYGNKDQETKIDYVLGGEPESATIQVAEGSQVWVSATTAIIGETVVLKPINDGCEFVTVKVDGQTLTPNADGTCSFTVTAATHTVEAVCKYVRDWNPSVNAGNTWDTTQQEAGIITSPAATHDTGWMYTYQNIYRDIALTLSDKAPEDKNFRMGIHFEFTNGEVLRLSLTNAASEHPGTYVIQVMSKNTIVQNWSFPYYLTDAQVEKLQGEGVEFRVAIVGTDAIVLLDNVRVCTLDLSGAKNSISGVSAKIAVQLSGNKGLDAPISYTLGGEPETGMIIVGTCENGKVTASPATYLIGEQVTLTATPDGGCRLNVLTLDGKTVTHAADGTYTFFTEKTSHTVTAAFQYVEDWNPNEVSGHNWDLTQQAGGIITSHGNVASGKTEGDTGWMYTYQNIYRDITLQVSDKYPTGNNFRMAVHLDFANGEKLRLSLTNAAGEEPGVYKIQTMSQNTIIDNKWGSPYYLTDAQVKKLQSDEGMEFRVAIVGTDALVLLDGVRVCTLDLSGAANSIEGVGAKIAVRLYGNNNLDTNVAYTLGGEPETFTVTLPATANGTITADQTYYVAGEKGTITVAGAAGYAHDSFTVDGKAAVTDLYGKYSFTAAKDITVDGSFAKSLFKSTVSGWLLENQHYGQIAVSYTNGNGHSNWCDFVDQYTDVDITLQAREYPDTKNLLTRSGIRFTFTNGKVITFSIAKNSIGGGQYKYTIQSLNGDNIVKGNHDFYVMTDAQIAKFNSEAGIEFRVIRNGTRVDIYLDGVLVVDGFDLAVNNNGVTADMPANLTIRRYDDPGIVAEYGIRVSSELPAPQIIIDPAITGGTVTADKESYAMGDTVTLTVAGSSGYYYSGLQINGKSVTLGWDGTYSFTADKAVYNVTASFAPTVFVGGDTRHWNLFKHHVGELMVRSHASGHSGWIDYTGTTNDVTTFVKDYTPDGKDFTMTYQFKFSNGETFNVRLHGTDGAGVYKIQSMNSTLFAAWKNRYTLSAEETAKVKGDGIEFRVIILDKVAHVYLDGVHVCEYDLTSTGKNIDNTTTTVTLRMDGNLNHDVYMTYKLANTTALPE